MCDVRCSVVSAGGYAGDGTEFHLTLGGVGLGKVGASEGV